MKSILLYVKKVLYRLGIDISFVRKEESRSAIELNEVDTVNKEWSNQKIRREFLSGSVLERMQKTIAILKDHKIDLDGKTVIDVGCGNGMFLKLISEQYKISSQTGMEYASKAIEEASRINPAAEYVVHDINLPYPQKYDAVFCTEVLEHVLYPGKAFIHMTEMVRDQGFLLLTVPDGRTDTFAGHINFWSPESWEVFLGEHSTGNKHVSGKIYKGLLYAIVYKDE